MCTARIALSSRPPAVRLTGSTGTSTTKCSAAWPTPPCEHMRTSCCTFSDGGRVFTTLTWSPKMPSPKQHSWTMYDSCVLIFLRYARLFSVDGDARSQIGAERQVHE